MQFLGTRRTIPEKVLNSLASSHHHHRRQSIESACSTGSSSRHTKWHSLLPTREISEKNVQSFNHNDYKAALQGGIAIRKTAARRGKFLEPRRSSSRLNDGEIVLLGDGGGERRPFSSSCYRLVFNNKDCQLTLIAARKGSVDLKDHRWGTSLFGATRGSKLRRYLSNGDDRGRRKPSRPEYLSEASREVEGGQRNGNDNIYDAILVLAGGQVAGGGVPAWVERRLDKALDLQQRSNKHGNNGGAVCKIVCLGGGTPHRAPILSSDGFVIHESTSCAEYLHRNGAPFAHLVKEWASYDTIGNGYFSLTQHVIPRRWRTLAVVTSEFHMPRTRAVFEWIFGLEGAGFAIQRKGRQLVGFADGVEAAARTGAEGQGFRLKFHSVPDQGDLDDSIAQARLERERNSIKNLSMLSQRIHNLEDFHEWFHTEHKAYNTQDQGLFGREDKSDPALQSY